MERRGFLTLTLCILFTLVYFKWLNPPPPPTENDAKSIEQPIGGPTDPTGTNASNPSISPAINAPAVPVVGDYPQTVVEVQDVPAFENEFLRVEFTNRGAGVKQVYLKEFFADLQAKIDRRSDPSGWVKLFTDDPNDVHRPALAVREVVTRTAPARWNLDTVNWNVSNEVSETGDRVIVFTYDASDGMHFEKRIQCLKDRHWLGVTLRASSRNPAHHGDSLELLVTAADGVADPVRGQFTDPPKAFAATVDEFRQSTVTAELATHLYESPKTITGNDKLKLAWSGAGNIYFAAMLRPETLGDASNALLTARKGDVPTSVAADLQVFQRIPRDGGASSASLRFFAGPKSKDLFVREDLTSFEPLVELDYGSWTSFRWINKLLLVILKFFHGLTGNWGVAVVFLTLVLRMAMFPVTRMQQVSMQKYGAQMAVLKPKLDELKARYKDNSQRFAQEQMKLLKEHKVRPPVVGCLTSFITIPVFVGMFQILRTSIDLRHAGFFGWIHDLSLPDAAFLIPGTHFAFNVLPILATLAFLWQMSLAPKPADPQAQQQQKIMMIMPVVFGVMFYGYAAGLSLYMLVSSLYGIFESKIIRKHFFPMPAAPAAPAGK